jgi:integrase
VALSPQLISLLWEQIARQRAKGHEFLFTSKNDTPRDMNVYRPRKMTPFLQSLEIPRAGFHAFRHFNVALLDALRVPLKTIQERIGHALTGSFTLDEHGGQPEWRRNLEAAQLVGVELEKAVNEAAAKLEQEPNAEVVGRSLAIQEKGSGATIS